METAMWSTRSVAPTCVPAFWSQALSQIMPGLQADPLDTGFEAILKQRELGPLRLNYVHATPQRVRTASQPRSAAAHFGLIYLKSGRLSVQQGARTTTLNPGECVLLDASRSSEVLTCCESRSLSISVGSAWLQQWLARPEAEVAKAFVPSSPSARPLLDLLELLSEIDAPLCAGDDLIANQLGGGLAIAVGEGEIVGTRHAARLIEHLRRGICARFYDPDYRPQVAADEAGISRRYLVALFTQFGTTFNAELMRIRLEKSAQMLCDTRFHSLSVMDISLRCGFNDLSHFSKRFRIKFGLSPARYRSEHLRSEAA